MIRPISASKLHRELRRLWRDRRGVEAIEFAMIGPVLIVATIGTMELGLAVFDFHRAGEATRRGARIAVIEQPVASLDDLKDTKVTCQSNSGTVSCDGGSMEASASFTEIVDAMREVLPTLTAQNIQVSYAPSTVIADDTEGLVTPLVTVSVVGYEHSFALLGSLPGLPGTITLPAFATTLLAPSQTVPVD
jgi:Flp pilus assembly protein TadG